MKLTKEQIEEQLYDMLNECLSSYNQDGSIDELIYNPETNTCTVVFKNIFIDENEQAYFQGY